MKKENILIFISYMLIIVILILSIISLKTSKNNQKDIKEIKERMGINSEEEVWIDETLDEDFDKELIGTWRYDNGNLIYVLKIDNKGTIEFTTYAGTEKLYNEGHSPKNQIKTEDLIKSGYYKIMSAKRGYFSKNTAIFNETYTEENGWKETNAHTESIYKTSDITVRTTMYKFEFTKQ